MGVENQLYWIQSQEEVDVEMRAFKSDSLQCLHSAGALHNGKVHRVAGPLSNFYMAFYSQIN